VSASTRRTLVSYGVGVLFGVGLIVGGMTQPAKVIAFLDFFGDWDPSLAFVMGGAVAVFMPLFRLVMRRSQPVCDTKFGVPTRKDIDAPLLVGSALFGLGWGIGGYCPGPAMTSLGSLAPNALIFTVAMLAGFALERTYKTFLSRSEERSTPQQPSSPQRPQQSQPA
jgi:uncharacterized membrane protein YedE/YeeE